MRKWLELFAEWRISITYTTLAFVLWVALPSDTPGGLWLFLLGLVIPVLVAVIRMVLYAIEYHYWIDKGYTYHESPRGRTSYDVIFVRWEPWHRVRALFHDEG